MIRAVIFDMDGLLIDSEPLWREAEIDIFGKKGIQLTENDCRGTTGMRVDEVVTHWSLVYPEAHLNVDATVQEIMERVTQLVVEKGKPMPGVYQVISLLEKKGVPMAIASASSNALIDTVVQKFGIKPKFLLIQSAEFMKYGKPHPEVFIETANRLSIPTNQCLVLEDSVYGVLAGKAAKMKVVAVPDHENYHKTGYCIADKKIPSLELFDEALWQELNAR